MTESQWSHADQAASALTTYSMETRDGEGYGDEGSVEYEEVVVGFLTDLKHQLFRIYGADKGLEDFAQEAVDKWAVEADALPEGGDDDGDGSGD